MNKYETELLVSYDFRELVERRSESIIMENLS